MKENELLVGIVEDKEKFNITYFCAESEDDYYDGNNDAYARWSIDKSTMTNQEDDEELIEQIKLYDKNYSNKEIVIVKRTKVS